MHWRPPPRSHALCCQVEELKTQLRMVEDARDGIRRDLIEAHRKVRESLEGHELQRKEIQDLRRSLSDEAKEKEAMQHSNQELRAAVKRAESDRIRWVRMAPARGTARCRPLGSHGLLHLDP